MIGFIFRWLKSIVELWQKKFWVSFPTIFLKTFFHGIVSIYQMKFFRLIQMESICISQNKCNLTLSQTTNFRLFQAKRVCRWQFQMLVKMTESSLHRQKTWWEKEKLLVMSNFSFSHGVFKRLVLQTRKTPGLCGKVEILFGMGRKYSENTVYQHFLRFQQCVY